MIAIIEIVSSGNKSNQTDAAAFINKASQLILAGIHLLIVDLYPPNPRAPQGIHRAIWGEGREGDFALPDDKPLTCVSYVGYPGAEVFLEPVAVGDELPDMPLFLSSETYILVPLQQTYSSAWRRVPAFLQEILADGKPPNGKRKSGAAGAKRTASLARLRRLPRLIVTREAWPTTGPCPARVIPCIFVAINRSCSG